MIQQSNIIKWAIISIIITSLIGYDCFNIVRDNFDNAEQQPSTTIYFLCNAAMWLISSSLIYYMTTRHYINFVWTRRWSFILLGLTLGNFVDELFNDNLVLHIGEWIFAFTWVLFTFKYIKETNSPTNEPL